jgi:hypothetical protein
VLVPQALKEDPDVSIVRVKSSMTRSGINPYVPTGLRFISLNLRIQTPQTARLVKIRHPHLLCLLGLGILATMLHTLNPKP